MARVQYGRAVAVILALVSALTYGISDFLGGIFSRRASAWEID